MTIDAFPYRKKHSFRYSLHSGQFLDLHFPDKHGNREIVSILVIVNELSIKRKVYCVAHAHFAWIIQDIEYHDNIPVLCIPHHTTLSI